MVSNDPCFACPGGSNSSMGATSEFDCTACPVAFYGSETGCQKCPQNSTSSPASEGIFNCTCIAGNEGSRGQVCTACIVGKFKAAGPGVCQSCPADTTSDAAAGNLTECKCNKVKRNTCPFSVSALHFSFFEGTYVQNTHIHIH